jgi:putative inorganic carbon (hco3(-)) transporter
MSGGEPSAPNSALAFRALMAFTFILVLAPQSFVPALRPWRIALIAAVTGIAAHLLDRALRAQPLMILTREMSFALGLAAWAVITVPMSYWPGGSVSFLLDTYFKTVAIFWLLGNVVDTLPRLRFVARALTVMAVPLAVTAVKNFVSGSFMAPGVNRIAGYQGGLTANPNDLALMLNLILPFTVALLVAARSALARVLLVAVALLQAAGVVVTFSRAGFLTLVTIVAVYVWRFARKGRLLFVAAAAAVALLAPLLLPAGYLGRLATIADIDADQTGSAQVRTRDSLAAGRYVLAHPLIGVGVGMNTLALNEVRGTTWSPVHDVYLEYAVDLGLPGLMLFLLLFLTCLRNVRSVRRWATSVPSLRELCCLAEAIEVALVAFAVAAFFHPVAYHFYFYYLAGLAVAASVVCERTIGQMASSVPPRTAKAS